MTDICPRLDRQNKSVAKGGRDRSACFQQRLKMGLGGFLKAQNRFAPVAPMRMTPMQQLRFRDPDTILVAAHLNLGKRDNHRVCRISELLEGVNLWVDSTLPKPRSPSSMPAGRNSTRSVNDQSGCFMVG